MTLLVRLRSCILAMCVLSSGFCYAGQHPVPLDQNSKCLDCHADHVKGEHVHPATAKGCASCHQVENRQDGTYVELKPAKSIRCFECHPPKTVSYSHFPYSSAMCLRCHNPHASANPHLLRAKVNELCLGCHQGHPDRPPSQYLPTILLTSDNSAGHPYAGHPVSKFPDPLTGDEMSCLSCHLPHGAMQPHLLKMGSEIPEDALNQNTETTDMCRKCHIRLWGLDRVPAKKKKRAKSDSFTNLAQ